jgi:hypothetical protein
MQESVMVASIHAAFKSEKVGVILTELARDYLLTTGKRTDLELFTSLNTFSASHGEEIRSFVDKLTDEQ